MSNKKDSIIELFNRFGFVLNNSQETFNVLNVDQRIFQNNLRSFIQKSGDNPSWEKNLTNIKKQIESYLDDDTNFYISLLPTRNNTDLIVSHSSNQDNLLKLLLEIKELQLELFEYLITKILTYSETNDSNGDVQIMNLNINVPCYIITQFKYQPKIDEPEKLCQKLMELISSINSVPIKKELVLCFPDILSDCQHDNLITELEELLGESELISVTLDTLSNLKFKNENISKITNKLFATYSVLGENDLPAAIKFMLKSAVSLNSKEILNNLRSKLQLDEISNETNRYIIFDILREYFHISNQLVDLFISIMTPNASENYFPQLQPIDFLIASLIYSIPQQFKQIDKTFKLILKQETFRCMEKSIEIVFKNGKSFIKELLDPVCLVAKSLIQNTASPIYMIGQLIYKIGFEIFDKKIKLEIINVLIELITCSNDASRDNALDVLIDLSSNSNPNPLTPFAMQIKTLLDYIEYFSLNQIRKLYLIICSVAYSISKPLIQPSVSAISSSLTNRTMDNSFINSSSIQDNLHILINKQLSSNSLRYKQIGVIGALMMIKNMTMKTRPSLDQDSHLSSQSEHYFSCSSSPNENNLPTNSTRIQNGSFSISSVNNEIKNIWQMILDSSKSSPESLGLFEDDLSSILLKDSISENMELLIKENLKEMTKNLFKLDLNPKASLSKYQSQLTSFKYGYEFGIDNHTTGVLNLLPLVMSDLQKKNSFLMDSSLSTNSSSQIPSIAIPSTFRLMCALERKNLDELKDYLGVPILSISKDELYKYGNYGTDSNLISTGSNMFTKFKHTLTDDERKIICNSIFFIINWFIELINAFSSRLNDDDDIKLKLIDRLTRVYELQNILCNLLPHMKYYKPPMVVFGLIDSSADELPYVHQLIKIKEVKGKGKGQAKRKGKVTKKKIEKKPKKEDLFGSEEEVEEKEIVGDTDDESEMTLIDDNKENLDSNTAEVDLNKLSIYFREFDLNLINFVNLDVELNPNVIPDSSKSQYLDYKLKPNILYFVLTDFNRKISLILKSNSTNSKLPGFAAKPTKLQQYLQLNQIEPKDLIKNLLETNLGPLVGHLDSINKLVKDIQAKNDGIKDPSEICNQKHNQILLRCLSQILKLIHQIFSWLNANNEQKLIDKIIRAFTNQIGSSSSANYTQIEKIPEIICFSYLSRLKDVILDLNTAFTLVQVLDLLANKIIVKKNDLFQAYAAKFRKVLCNTCSDFLVNDYNIKLNNLFSTRQSNNESIVNLLNMFIQNSENSLEIVEKLVGIIVSQEFLEDRQNCGDFNTLKLHFISYYKVLLEYSVNKLKFIEKSNSLINDENENIENFSKIRTLVQVHCGLVELKKSKNFKDINILTVIKNSKLFLNNFLKYSMRCLDHVFENHKEEVVQTLQIIQKSTHFIQEICVTNDQSAIAKQAPIYMRSIEAFMVRIRQLLYVNRYDDAFTVNLFENKLKISTKPAKKTEKTKTAKNPAEKGKKKNSKKEKSPEPEMIEQDESEIEDEDDQDVEDEDDEDEE